MDKIYTSNITLGHARDGQNIYLKYNFENQTKTKMTEISAPWDKEKWEREQGFDHFEAMGFEVVTLGISLHYFLPKFW